MAIIQLNGIISNIKGSVGGVTFSNVRAGIALKKRLPGKKSLNSNQLYALNNNKQSAVSWTALTFGQKQAWNNFASVNTFTNRFGAVITLTGFNWFTTINFNRLWLNQSIALVPPTYAVPDALPVAYVNMTQTTITVDWSTAIDTGTTDVLVYASTPSKSQADYNRGSYKILDLTGVDVSSSFDITSAWQVATGTSYASVAASGIFNINILIVPVSKSSYISGVGVTATSQVPRSGVGYMVIGSSFIVS